MRKLYLNQLIAAKLLILIAIVLIPDRLTAESIGVNFQGTGTTLANTTTAGFVPQTNWNNASGDSGLIANALNDSAIASDMAVSWASRNGWQTGDSGTGNDQLFDGYLDSNGFTVEIGITNIPYTAYDLYVYMASDNPGGDGGASLDGGATSLWTLAASPLGYNGSFIEGTATSAGTAVEGNYVKFDSQTDQNTTITIVNFSGSGNRNSCVGFQIVDAVPPSPTLDISEESLDYCILTVGDSPKTLSTFATALYGDITISSIDDSASGNFSIVQVLKNGTPLTAPYATTLIQGTDQLEIQLQLDPVSIGDFTGNIDINISAPAVSTRQIDLSATVSDTPSNYAGAAIVINEFMAVNDTILQDEDGEFSDWIELKNTGTQRVDLNGWYLTDNSTNLMKWQFPHAIIEPGEFLVVFASGKNRATACSELHTGFKLSGGGEFLALTEADGTTIRSQYAPQFPPQSGDISYGFPADNLTTTVFFTIPTPGAENTLAPITKTVIFSVPSRTFSGSFLLAMTGISNPQQTIQYTTDGSIPTTASMSYSGPITINATTQIRALITEPSKAAGPVASVNYSELGADVLAFQSQLPILLIDNFGAGSIPSKGWNQTGAGIHQVPRQLSALSFFDNSGGMAQLNTQPDLNVRSGLRVRGAFSSTFPEPQYSVETWDEANQDYDIAMFDMAPESDFILYSPNPTYDNSMMNNQFMYQLARAMGIWAPRVQFVEAFLNTDGGDVTMADYVGLYVWMEKVKRDSGRLDFNKFSDAGDSGGWLLEINRMAAIPEDDPTAIQPHFHTPGPNGISQTPPNAFGSGDDIPRQGNAFLNFDHPNGYGILPAQRQSIEDWFKNMENVLYDRVTTAPWTDPVVGYANYIDVDKFIDYFILHNLSKNGDGLLLSMWVYNPDPANGGKLQFGPPWDYDLGAFEGSPTASLLYRSDRLWFARLFQDPEFVQRYRDRWQMWRQNVLADSGMNSIFDAFEAEIGNDAFVRDGVNNITSRINIVKAWLSTRAAAIDAQFVALPVFSQNGGEVTAGFQLGITAATGIIYYTSDGSDPRLSGGAISTSATMYSGLIPLNQSQTIVARVNDGGNWSGSISADFFIGAIQATAANLKVAELHYNPSSPDAIEVSAGHHNGEFFEFIELINLSPIQTIDLKNVSFTDGVVFTFANFTELAPGERAILVSNEAAFEFRNGTGIRIIGQYGGYLNNDGEVLEIIDGQESLIQNFDYNDNPAENWPLAADGFGPSMEVVDFQGDYNLGTNWVASYQPNGTPGSAPPLTVRITSTEINSGESTDLTAIAFTATFNLLVNGFNANGLQLTNGFLEANSFSGSDGDNQFQFKINPVSFGPVSIRIPAAAAQSAANSEDNLASQIFSFTFSEQPTEARTLWMLY